MSKKSRKRNKKILAALALAGGAAMLAKGKFGKGASAVSTAGQPVGVDRITPKTDYITKKAVAADTSGPVLNVTGGVHADKIAKGTMLKERALTAGNRVPPSMRGGAPHAEGYQKFVPPNRQWPGGYIGRKGGGIAKRGTGAAYKSGGRVKSMGIAKRGGGIAKR